jgi:hypothetical protein
MTEPRKPNQTADREKARRLSDSRVSAVVTAAYLLDLRRR